MLGMRSFTLKARAEATERVVKKKLPDGLTTSVESQILTVYRSARYYNYANLSSGAEIKRNLWWLVIDAHVNINNQKGETVAQIVVNQFGFGKPEVNYLDPSTSEQTSIARARRNKKLANDIAKTIRLNGFFLFKPEVEQGIVSGNGYVNLG